MRIVIVGQQAFGKAVLEAFVARGDEIAGVFAAPERPGARPDPLVVAAQERGLTVHRHAKYSSDEAKEALAELDTDLGVMAYVLLFAPPEFCAIPKHGMIQFHPSLLPLHRGPSSIPWAIIRGRSETGLSIFRPTPGLDEGPVILQKRVPIGPDETAGSLYFDKIFPLGVEALVQAADLVVSGRATETTQDEGRATYEGWVRDAESRINWATHVVVMAVRSPGINVTGNAALKAALGLIRASGGYEPPYGVERRAGAIVPAADLANAPTHKPALDGAGPGSGKVLVMGETQSGAAA